MADFDINDPSFTELTPDQLLSADKGLVDGRNLRRYVIMLKMLARQYHTGTQTAATISDFAAQVSANGTVTSNTNAASNAQSTADTAITNASNALSAANSAQSDATSAKGKTDQIIITASTDLDAIRAKLNSITGVGSGIIISGAERTKLSEINDFVLSKTSQSLSGTSQAFNLNSGWLSESTISGTTTLTFSNVQTGRNGIIYLINTNGETLNLSGATFQKSNQGILESYAPITLEAGAATVQILTYHCRSNTQVTYEIK